MEMGKFKLFFLLSVCFIISGQEISSDISIHYPLMRDVVIKDMKQSKAKIYRIAAVHFYDEDDSKSNADEIYQLLKGDLSIISETTGKEVEIFSIAYRSKAKFYVETSNKKVNFAYISQEFDEEDIERVKFVCDKNKILSFTAVEEYFDLGISAAVLLRSSIPSIEFNESQLIKERPDYFKEIQSIAVKE